MIGSRNTGSRGARGQPSSPPPVTDPGPLLALARWRATRQRVEHVLASLLDGVNRSPQKKAQTRLRSTRPRRNLDLHRSEHGCGPVRRVLIGQPSLVVGFQITGTPQPGQTSTDTRWPQKNVCCPVPANSSRAPVSEERTSIGSSGTMGGWSHAFLWQNSKMTDLGTLPGGRDSYASAINKRAQIIGYSTTKTGQEHAVLWGSAAADLSVIPSSACQRRRGCAGSVVSAGSAWRVRMRRIALFVIAVVAVLAVSGAAGSAGSVQPLWVITDLGTLGGRESRASAINASGQVVGWSEIKGRSMHPFLWRQGKAIDLAPTAGGAARAINDRGEIVGTDGRHRAFLWRNGKLTYLGSLHGLSDRSAPPDYVPAHSYTAFAINARSQIVGMTYPDSSQDPSRLSFIWRKGKMTRIDGDVLSLDGMGSGQSVLNENGEVVGGRGYPERPFIWSQGRLVSLRVKGHAAAINDRDQVVGTSLNGFLWEKGRLTDLGTLPGDAASYAIAINEQGQVAGSSGGQGAGQSAYRPYRAFLWQDGQMTQIGPKARASFAWAMNDNGVVIGLCVPLSSSTAEEKRRAFVWDGTQPTVLPTLGGRSSDANAINNQGQIVGWATTKNGQKHAVLWTLRSG